MALSIKEEQKSVEARNVVEMNQQVAREFRVKFNYKLTNMIRP